MSENTDDGVRPNENRTFNYVMSGQIFHGDQEVLRIEPKKGFSFDQVESQLRRDYKGVRVVQKDLAQNVMYITGTPIMPE